MLRSFFRDRSLELSEAYFQARRAFQIDPNQNFVRVKNRIGLTASGIYAQIYFSEKLRYKKFRREIELHQNHGNSLNREVDVLVVLPPRGSINNVYLKLLLKQSFGLATSAGFSYVSQAQLNTDRVIHGAKRLHKLVLERKKAGRKLILVSYSFGSAFVRTLLDQSSPDELSHIKGWANLSGMIFGSPLYNCSDKKSLLLQTTPSQRTFSCEQKHFSNSPKIHNIKTVHFLGMKNNENLTRQELRQREKIKAWGPSDGFVTFEPYQNLEQTIVPLFDQGHLIDLSKMSMTFVRTLSAMVSTLPRHSPFRESTFKHPEIL